MGEGGANDQIFAALRNAMANGIVVVRSSRTGGGRVGLGFAEFDDQGFLVADDLNPQKARILLMLALTKTDDLVQIQEMFFKY